MTRILFVCLGNICRSPSAEAVTRRMAADRGQTLIVESAGTGDWHIGAPPYGAMTAAAARRGYDLAPLRARQITVNDFTAFDLIVVMDQDNRAEVERLRPVGSGTPVRLFLDFAPGSDLAEVPDPYYARDFDQALDLIEAAAEGLLDHLSQNASAVSPKAL